MCEAINIIKCSAMINTLVENLPEDRKNFRTYQYRKF